MFLCSLFSPWFLVCSLVLGSLVLCSFPGKVPGKVALLCYGHSREAHSPQCRTDSNRKLVQRSSGSTQPKTPTLHTALAWVVLEEHAEDACTPIALQCVAHSPLSVTFPRRAMHRMSMSNFGRTADARNVPRKSLRRLPHLYAVAVSPVAFACLRPDVEMQEIPASLCAIHDFLMLRIGVRLL